MKADEVKQMLGLVPHPREGGWYVRSYEATETLHLDRYSGDRRTGTAIYYLLEPGTFSEMHRLQSDEVFHFYLGDPVEMLQLLPDGSGRLVLLGTDLAAGERPQAVVERGIWQGSALRAGGSWALLGCTVSPGFEFEDYESGKREPLCAAWPAWEKRIHALTHARAL